MINITARLALKLTITTFSLLLVGAISAQEETAVDNTLNSKSAKAMVLTEPPVSPSKHWHLVWEDEFNGKDIDKNKWSFEENCWGGGNEEQQCYTDSNKNAFVKDGKLNIVAFKGDFTGSDDPEGKSAKTKTLPYTSARLRTKDKGDWKYGRYEIRAKLPQGQGTWPAIWMLPTDWVYGSWAASGEIDIVEAVNLNTPSGEEGAKKDALETRVFGSLHYGGAWPNNVSTGQATHLPKNANPAEGFHTYAIEWEEGEIRWYIDNVHFETQRQSGWYSRPYEKEKLLNAKGSAPFNERFHLLMNLAVGGNWAANENNHGIDHSAFPQTLAIDFVRVYRCSKNHVTGKGCASVSDQIKIESNQNSNKHIH